MMLKFKDTADLPREGEGFLMLSSLNIQNFKCFEDLKLDNLKRVNILVGENSSGKTSFLEALFLAGASSPGVVLRLKGWRGITEAGHVEFELKHFNAIWKDLFYSFDQGRNILIELKGEKEPRRTLEINFSQREQIEFTLDPSSNKESFLEGPIIFHWQSEDGKTFTVSPSLTPKGIKIESFPGLLDIAFYSAFLTPSPMENATRFSELRVSKKHSGIVKTLTTEFPFIEDLSVELHLGKPVIHATLANLDSQIPLGNISGGINKLMSLLLAMAYFPKGYVLIDEIENGFYYERLPSVWRMLFEASKSYETQIFASTHSWECLKALTDVFKCNPEEFCVLKTEKRGKSVIVRQFEGKNVLAALEQDMELR